MAGSGAATLGRAWAQGTEKSRGGVLMRLHSPRAGPLEPTQLLSAGESTRLLPELSTSLHPAEQQEKTCLHSTFSCSS